MPRRHDPAQPRFTPKPEQQALMPAVSGNTINGLGEPAPRRPKPIYWHDPATLAHGRLQQWFFTQTPDDPRIHAARAERQRIVDTPLAPLATSASTLDAQQWTDGVKAAAREHGADLVGIARMRDDWVFEGHHVAERWVIVIGVGHAFDAMRTAPDVPAAVEVIRQYGRGNRAANGVASWIRARGHGARAHGGPMAGPAVLIPAALACGFGELGKHGSIINRALGSSFRLAAVFTDVPLLPDAPDAFGADDFCTRCRVCADACPPGAIGDHKQQVRGALRWYVDFDRCLPYFNEHMGCGICVAVCPWSLPGVAANLVTKFARRTRDADG